jgi:protein O-GlcNAc transferase
MAGRVRPPPRKAQQAARSHFAEAEQLRLAGRHAEAIAAYREAIALEPRFTAAHNNCAASLLMLGEFGQALEHHDRAILFDPRNPAFHFNRGRCLHALARLPEAMQAWERCLRLDPSFTLARHDLGVACLAQHAVDRAVALLETVVEAEPTFALARVNLASALRARGDLLPALEQAEAAARLDPDLHDAWTVAVHLLAYGVDSVEVERGRAIFAGFDASVQRRAEGARAQAGLPERSAQPDRPARTARRAGSADRLRVGFLSADLRMHPVGYFLEPVTQWLHTTRLDCIAYDLNPRPDEVTARLQRAPITWRRCEQLDDFALARLIADDDLDVLVELSGCTAGNRLPMLALRPAPVQLTWLGMPGTPGLSCLDGRIVDPFLDSPYDPYPGPERSLQLPHSWVCVLPDARAPEVAPPPFARNGYVTFGAFTGGTKLGERVLGCWAELLASVPDSRLIATGVPAGRCAERLAATFAARGVGPERLELVPTLPHLDWLARLGDADIALDSWPYNGTTTSTHSLWMGVPLVSHHGPTPAWRAGLSLLSNLGLEALSAPDEAGFLRIARALAADHARRAELRAGMRERMRASPLMDGQRYAQDLEALLRSL